MSHFNKIMVGERFAEQHSFFANYLYKKHTPISEMKLRTCNAMVLEYRSAKGYTVYLLKSYDTIVAMISELGNGIDFLRYVYGYTATSAQHIRKFFDDYCKENARIFVYKP